MIGEIGDANGPPILTNHVTSITNLVTNLVNTKPQVRSIHTNHIINPPLRREHPVNSRTPSGLAQRLASHYECGHCTSTTEFSTDDQGTGRLAIRHDTGCPVLTGTLSPRPDTLRALAGIPATFRP